MEKERKMFYHVVPVFLLLISVLLFANLFVTIQEQKTVTEKLTVCEEKLNAYEEKIDSYETKLEKVDTLLSDTDTLLEDVHDIMSQVKTAVEGLSLFGK